MSLETGLITALRDDATIGPLVANGTSPETYRIFHERLPQEPTYPAIVYSRVATDLDTNPLDGPNGLTSVILDIDAVATSRDDMKALGDAIKTALNGVTGALGAATVQLGVLEDRTDQSIFAGDKAIRIDSLTFRFTLYE